MVTIAACSPTYTYFTQDLYRSQNWSQSDVERIQFYTSRDIVLSRAISAGETAISGGKIEIRDNDRIEKVIIPQGTPGVLVLMPREDRFAISFDKDDDVSYLMFGPNPKLGSRYALLAQSWEKNQGFVHYKGNVYQVDAEYAQAALMVDLKKTGREEYVTKKASGRMVNN
jgi:hypothetical protein